MKVKALRPCFDTSLHDKGDIFDYTPFKDKEGKDVIPKYLEPIVPRGTVVPPVKAAEPKK